MNRHLDQLVMCTIYSVAKISDLKQITFNTIINKYAYLFQSKEYVSKIYTQCVISQDSGETQDIISFYNQVYLKQMKQYIILYKGQAKKASVQLQQITPAMKAQTPGVFNKDLPAVLTPNGTKPYIKAFCPQTPLLENYPSKHLSMRTIFQRGQINESQILELN